MQRVYEIKIKHYIVRCLFTHTPYRQREIYYSYHTQARSGIHYLSLLVWFAFITKVSNDFFIITILFLKKIF